MDLNEILKKVREHVVESFVLEDEEEFSNDQSFLDTGLIDSTGILEVIGFLEDEFEIAIEDDEMIPDHLDSVEKIARFVHRKQDE
ncbi:MAG: acyl carrier protein [Deltaproteobacteria bacterium]|jgi:acyl carrier protein|nr:acyl carrier protein [Deltaproteobacteria bacterium]